MVAPLSWLLSSVAGVVIGDTVRWLLVLDVVGKARGERIVRPSSSEALWLTPKKELIELIASPTTLAALTAESVIEGDAVACDGVGGAEACGACAAGTSATRGGVGNTLLKRSAGKACRGEGVACGFCAPPEH